MRIWYRENPWHSTWHLTVSSKSGCCYYTNGNVFWRWPVVFQDEPSMTAFLKEVVWWFLRIIGKKEPKACRLQRGNIILFWWWLLFLLLFFTPIFSGEGDLVSRQNLTASKTRGLESSAVIANVKSNLPICFGASGRQGQLECCYFLFQIKESAPRYHRNHQPNYKEFCALDKSHHFSFLHTLIQVPKILPWTWSWIKGFALFSKMVTARWPANAGKRLARELMK